MFERFTEEKIGETEIEISEKVVQINRVSKVVKGGRRFSFNAIAVVGDKNGSVGAGIGKANEVPDAIRKAIESARKKMTLLNLTRRNTLPHESFGRFKASKVYLRPASPGTGLIAGEAVRFVLEQAGIHDVLTKVVGSKNMLNVVHATMSALQKLETPLQFARKRRIHLYQLFEGSEQGVSSNTSRNLTPPSKEKKEETLPADTSLVPPSGVKEEKGKTLAKKDGFASEQKEKSKGKSSTEGKGEIKAQKENLGLAKKTIVKKTTIKKDEELQKVKAEKESLSLPRSPSARGIGNEA